MNASGGYYIAVAAERIIASPFTITGSIGVVASKPNISQAAAHLGVRAISITRGRGAALLDAYVEEAYACYLDRCRGPSDVSGYSRGSPRAGGVDRTAGSRTGLVDQIGAYLDVVAAARELAHIPASNRHEIVWAGLREAFLQTARRLSGFAATDILPAELDTLRITHLERALWRDTRL